MTTKRRPIALEAPPEAVHRYHREQARERAVGALTHYLKLAGAPTYGDHGAEVTGIVDDILEAAEHGAIAKILELERSRIKSEIMRHVAAELEKNDPADVLAARGIDFVEMSPEERRAKIEELRARLTDTNTEPDESA